MADTAATAFENIGLDKKVVSTTLKNDKLTEVLLLIIAEAKLTDGKCEKVVGNLLYNVAAAGKVVDDHKLMIARYIGEKKIKMQPQLDAALNYSIKCTAEDVPIDVTVFETETGVGVEVTVDQIREVVKKVLEANAAELKEKRYRANIGVLLRGCREDPALKWADGALVKKELDAGMLSVLGPKTEEDTKPVKKVKAKKEKAPKKEAEKASTSEAPTVADWTEKFDDGRDMEQARNSAAILKAHREATGGCVMTRFPPEPNGYLHIGHAKAMNINFGYAKAKDGKCYLRFDDTNPAAEKMEYIESITENVKWLGHEPYKVTYSSDYFDKIYDAAVQLIKADKAFVCHQTKDEMDDCRQKKIDSPWRNRPIEESLQEFENMKNGLYKAGEATLRMKMDMSHANPCMRDTVAYRIIHQEHPKSGKKWCIYPSYDFTHGLCDSLENITHSLCTLEFEVRRDSYYWQLAALDFYRPKVWEYSRLNITHNVLSKRKLHALVFGGHVSGWDDPRLLTVNGLRRRGYTANAINTFCNTVGVSRNENMINMNVLEHCIRSDLDASAARVMVVLDPVKVTIKSSVEAKTLEVPNHPKNPELGNHKLFFSSNIFIERDDFRLEDSKDYFGLAPGKAVSLKHVGCNITCEDVIKDANGNVTELVVSADFSESRPKCKGTIHWVSAAANGQPVRATVRLYDKLFTVPNPAAESDAMSKLNPESLIVKDNAVVDEHFRKEMNAKVFDHFQFERVGYFNVDLDTTDNSLVFNRTVSLREAKEKK